MLVGCTCVTEKAVPSQSRLTNHTHASATHSSWAFFLATEEMKCIVHIVRHNTQKNGPDWASSTLHTHHSTAHSSWTFALRLMNGYVLTCLWAITKSNKYYFGNVSGSPFHPCPFLLLFSSVRSKYVCVVWSVSQLEYWKKCDWVEQSCLIILTPPPIDPPPIPIPPPLFICIWIRMCRNNPWVHVYD